ncbi:hypothetical protein [Synechococcus sp. CBW1108]|uniref:hypothetical protein n=1 Tax=Synechococcus sp. CBW1108 TaxID=1353147 RepID=UPI0018CFE572|nr:hypothetical protein [Synechococcus sp. CBW1108]QPN68784.1 hypothetical protein H8F27_08705 [Synechococcus sp. CBW1108]
MGWRRGTPAPCPGRRGLARVGVADSRQPLPGRGEQGVALRSGAVLVIPRRPHGRATGQTGTCCAAAAWAALSRASISALRER